MRGTRVVAKEVTKASGTAQCSQAVQYFVKVFGTRSRKYSFFCYWRWEKGTSNQALRRTLRLRFSSQLANTSRRAIEQMKSYKPAEHDETKSVAPLLQFFELVHIGDTMQSMIQVYFDKELVSGLVFAACVLDMKSCCRPPISIKQISSTPSFEKRSISKMCLMIASPLV